MIKKLFLLLFILFFSSYAQSGWSKQQSETTNQLNSIWLNSKDDGFIVGAEGLLLKTTNGGNDWQKQSITNENLTKIHFIDSNNGYILGENNTYLQTNDGGNTWINRTNSLETGLLAISYLNSQNGIAIGGSRDSMIIYKTSDGGVTWENFSMILNKYISSPVLHYQNLERMALVYRYISYNHVLCSNDSGKTWAETKVVTNRYYGGVGSNYSMFVDSTTGYLLGNDGMTSIYYSYIYKTTDGGRNWQGVSNGKLPVLFNLYFVDSNNGYAIGYTSWYRGDDRPCGVYKTTDGGTSWERKLVPLDYKLTGLFFVDEQIGTLIGKNGLILKTENAGTIIDTSEWKLVYQETDPIHYSQFRSVDFLTNNIAISVGGGLVRTKDTGKHWTSSLSPGGNDISFYNADYGISVSGVGTIYSTTNGGNDWSTYQFPEDFENYMRWKTLNGVSYIDKQNIIVIAIEGAIVRSSDGGASWSVINSGTTADLKDVLFVNSEVGYIVGNNGVILKSVDRGYSWSHLSVNTSESLLGVYFSNVDNGFIVGSNGTILETTDAGQNWNIQPRITNYD